MGQLLGLGLPDTPLDGIMILGNVRKYIPSDKAS
jgi:hypothetical protein